jgi:hypothetical protein
VDRASDDFGWLAQVSPELCRVIADTSTLDSSDNQIANFEGIVARSRNLGLNLLEPFLRFMRDTSLQGKIPTCTACSLALSEDFIQVPGADGSFLLRFMNDSQSCVMWYLCLDREGIVGVVASFYFFEPEIFEAMGYEEVKREDLFKNAFLCADTFAEFMYRFWVENTIWYSLHEQLPLTLLQEEYQSQITKKL